MTNEEIALSIQQGREDLIPELWERVHKFIYLLAGRYYRRAETGFTAAGVTLDDLKQEGYFIMLDALIAWTPESGFSFLTFTRYPLRNRLNTILGTRSGRIKRDPLSGAASLDEPLPGTDDITRGDTVIDHGAENDFEEAEQAVYTQKLRADLETAIDGIGVKSGAVVRLYYFKGQTLGQIAAAQGFTPERARQMKAQGLNKLRKNKHLEQYRQYTIDRHAYKSGLSRFRESGTSSTERTVELLDRLERQLNLEPYKT